MYIVYVGPCRNQVYLFKYNHQQVLSGDHRNTQVAPQKNDNGITQSVLMGKAGEPSGLRQSRERLWKSPGLCLFPVTGQSRAELAEHMAFDPLGSSPS